MAPSLLIALCLIAVGLALLPRAAASDRRLRIASRPIRRHRPF